MRFETKFDWWIVVALMGAAAVTLPLPALRILKLGTHSAPFWLAFFPWLVWAYVLSCTLPQYYDVRPDGLFIRQGWRKILLPYASLAGVQPVSEALSAAVFSTDRVLVTTRQGKSYVIAPAEQSRFLDEISRRTLLERKGSGLGLPFSPLAGI